VQSVQWYRVDDWGNTEMINGATHQEYTVSCAEARFFLDALRVSVPVWSIRTLFAKMTRIV